MYKKSQLQKSRLIVQIFFIILVFSIVLFKYLSAKGFTLPFSVSGFHALCPFGAVATFTRYILHGKFIPETQPSNFWIFLSVILLTLILGRVFCGWICPLGSVQEYVFNAGKKLRKTLYSRLPGSLKTNSTSRGIFRILNIFLSSLKYLLLIIIIVQTTRKVSLMFGKIDPYYALFNFWTGDVLPPAIIVLAAVLFLSLFVYRPWCRYFCPLGAVLGIVQILSPFKMRRNDEICINCGLCSKKCPQKIYVADKKTVYNTECIKCGQCISCCPVSGSLNDCCSAELNHRFALRVKYYPVIILLIFLIPVAYGKFFSGFYYNEKSPAIQTEHISPENNRTADSGSTGLLIKSSFTLQMLADYMNISVSELKVYIGIKSSVPDNTKLRDVEDSDPGVTFKIIKQKVSEYL